MNIRQIGIGYGDPEQDKGFLYFAGLILPQGVEAEGLERLELDGGRYVEHRLIGRYALISSTFQTLFGGWLPQNGLDPDDRPVIELYRNNLTLVSDDERITDLLIPIRTPTQ